MQAVVLEALGVLDADASRPAALRILEIRRVFLRIRALPDGRLDADLNRLF